MRAARADWRAAFKRRVKRMPSQIRRRLDRMLRPLRAPAVDAAPPLPESYPHWADLLGREAGVWKAARRTARRGPPVLIATSVGGFIPGTFVESLLAVALTLRGAQVHLLLCDEALPACLQATVNDITDEQAFVRAGPAAELCHKCFPAAYRLYQQLGLPVHRYSDFIDARDRQQAHTLARAVPVDDIRTYALDGLAIGQHAYANAVRFFARSTLEGLPNGEAVLRRYLAAALLTAVVTRRVLHRFKIEAACFHHGIYVPQGIVGEAARQFGARVVNWNAAYRKQCFMFSHSGNHQSTFRDEPNHLWEDLPWNAAIEAYVVDYLESRSHGSRDWIFMNREPHEDVQAIAAQMGLDLKRPWVGLLTNLMWDAQLFYPSNAFPTMLDWVLETIAYFATRPDLQLIIRVHPGEIKNGNPTRQPILAELQKHFPTLPPNVFTIAADSPISTYAMMRQCNAVVIYGTKTGLELAAMGVPIIVAGEAWIRNKGFTYDATSPAQYRSYLEQLPLSGPLTAEQLQRARKYAFHFFFRRMIPLEVTQPAAGWPPFRIQVSSLSDLQPHQHPGLDLICDGILRNKRFVYPAETQFSTVASDGIHHAAQSQ